MLNKSEKKIIECLCVFIHISCVQVWVTVSLTVMHESIVAEPNTQRHSIISSLAVSLGNQISDTQSVSYNACAHLYMHTAEGSIAGQTYLCVCWIEDGDGVSSMFQ